MESQVMTQGLPENKGQGKLMPGHTDGSLKPGNSGSRKRVRTEEISYNPQPVRQNVKCTKTGGNSLHQLSEKDTHDVFTDFDAIEIFNRVLLKKRFERDP